MKKRERAYRFAAGFLAALTIGLTACQATEQTPPPEEPEQTVTEPELPPEPEATVVQEIVPPVEEPEVPPEPEYQLHAAYMRGNDYFFHPDQPLSRAETAKLLTKLFQPGTEPVTFTDVPADAWYTESVSQMAAWLPGYEDGAYHPAAEITPAEFIGAILRLLETEVTDPVVQAVELGWMEEAAAAATHVTRAEATVILNRALGRVPDRETLDSLETPCFLDVTPEHAAYYDILEAALTHAYLEEDGEHWNADTIEGDQMREGLYRTAGAAYCIDAEGRIVTEPGLYHAEEKTYLILESGQAAPAGLQLLDGQVLCVTEEGHLLKDGLWGEYRFDADGVYTTGDEALDAHVAAALAACTTEAMTREEKLRAAYDYVRAFKYLGRNSALPASCKTIPMENAVAYATKIFETGKGDCYNFAAAFCFLARALGCEARAIAGSCGYVWNTVAITHGWVEIIIDGETYLFDPQIENYNLRAGISNDLRSAYQVTYASAPANYYPN